MEMTVESKNEWTVELKAHGVELPAAEHSKIEGCLHAIREAVECFPVKSLEITVNHHHRTDDFHVKTSLKLPGRTLFTGERNRSVLSAVEACVDKLLKKIKNFKLQMQSDEERTKQVSGSHHTVAPTLQWDLRELEDARFSQDYLRFRKGLDGFQSSLNNRIGRWIQRYPEIEKQLSDWITLSDIVEDVFFHAYERFEERSPEIPPGKWLEELIDPTIQDLLHCPEAEFANICYSKHRLQQNPR
jgi:ribosome-associated translation inhibitor RaiA